MYVEVVGLQAVDDRSHLANPSILKLEDRDAGRRVFVLGEFTVRRMCGIGTHYFHVLAHAEQERIKGVATSREQAAAAGILARVPSELAIPRSNTVIVIYFPVVDAAK